MPLTHFTVPVGFFGSTQLADFADLMAIHQAMCGGMFLAVVDHVAATAPETGVIDGFDPYRTVQRLSNVSTTFNGTCPAVAMKRAGLLEEAADGQLRVANWQRFGGAVEGQLRANRQRQSEYRARTRSSRNGDVTVMATSTSEVSELARVHVATPISSPTTASHSKPSRSKKAVKPEDSRQMSIMDITLPTPQLGPKHATTAEDLRQIWNDLPRPPVMLPRWPVLNVIRQQEFDTLASTRPIEGPEGWRAIIHRIGRSAFCNGRGVGGRVPWKPEALLDRNGKGNVENLLAGYYDSRNDLGLDAFEVPEERPGSVQAPSQGTPVGRSPFFAALLDVIWSKVNGYTFGLFGRMLQAEVQGGVLVLSLPDPFMRNWIDDHYRELMLSSARSLDPSVTDIGYHTESESETKR